MTNNTQALELVLARNAFYRRLHFLVLGAFALSVAVIITLAVILYFLIKNPTQPVFFATDPVGKLIHEVPISQPNMSNEQVMAWVIEAVQAAFSYDYINYPAQLQSAQKYFTNYGWTNYMKSIRRNTNLIGVKEHKLVVIAQVVEPPKLITQGLLGGGYAWKFQFPMLVNFWQPPYDDNSKILNAWVVKVIVQRQPILQSYQGLGIIQVIAEQAQ